MQDQYSRTQLLLGAEAMEKLHNSRVAVFGIGGVVTFKKSRLADTVREMELDDLVLETDCPYLTPVPYRGQRNESGYIPYICNKIAALKGTTPEEVAAATTRNARRMFGFDAARQTTNDHSSPTESI
jgi:TatD DNase family protein